jgi:hypothetical protein
MGVVEAQPTRALEPSPDPGLPEQPTVPEPTPVPHEPPQQPNIPEPTPVPHEPPQQPNIPEPYPEPPSESPPGGRQV